MNAPKLAIHFECYSLPLYQGADSIFKVDFKYQHLNIKCT